MATAARPAWTRIGDAAITDARNRVTIPIARRTRYPTIRICVNGHAARLLSALVTFRAGASQNLAINALVPAGGCTRALVVRGRGLDGLAGIRITYDPPSLAHRRVLLVLFAR
jgi:hypothetical protein